MLSLFVPLVTIIGAWYAAAWLRNGWWLWLIVPALPVGTILVIAVVWKIRAPSVDFGLAMAAEAVGINVGVLVGFPLAVIIAVWTRFKMRRRAARGG